MATAFRKKKAGSKDRYQKYTVRYQLPDGTTKDARSPYTSKREALAWARSMEEVARIEAASRASSTAVTLGDQLDHYVRTAAGQGISKGWRATVVGARRVIDELFVGGLARPLAEITNDDIAVFRQRVLARPRWAKDGSRTCTPATANRYASIIRTAVNQAVARGVLARGALRLDRLRLPAEQNRRTRLITDEEFGRLVAELRRPCEHVGPRKASPEQRLSAVKLVSVLGIEAAAKVYGVHEGTLKRWVRRHQRKGAEGLADRARRVQRQPLAACLVMFQRATGARNGEALNLRWRDVDMDGCVATFTETKNGTTRAVPLGDLALHALEQMGGKGLGYVFSATGQRLKNYPRSTVMEAAARAGIDDFVPHLLRHAWATNMVENGASSAELQEAGGWKSAKVAARYTHARSERLRHLAQVTSSNALSLVSASRRGRG